MLDDATRMGSRYDDEESSDAALFLQQPALWAFLTPPDGPLALVDHAADERTLWLLRVRIEEAP
jgi:hypothetical protein